jgi:putative SOS response-associated peptidase YedK
MCNLYRMTKTRSEVAAWFDAADGAQGGNWAEEVYPGYPGLVVAQGAVKAMAWGFPLVLKGQQGQPLKPKPVNNARTDKLDSFFWRDSFANRRCLIPLTAWAEAQGPKGAMTRTWLSLPDQPLFAAAGVWRESDEWGACYAMVMTDSAGSDAAAVHSRMPVLIAPDDYAAWLTDSPRAALEQCHSFTGAIAIDPTDQPWARRSATA